VVRVDQHRALVEGVRLLKVAADALVLEIHVRDGLARYARVRALERAGVEAHSVRQGAGAEVLIAQQLAAKAAPRELGCNAQQGHDVSVRADVLEHEVGRPVCRDYCRGSAAGARELRKSARKQPQTLAHQLAQPGPPCAR
jgi:hypothetical protein